MGGYSGGKQESKQESKQYKQSDSIPSIFLTFEEMSKSWQKKNKKETEIEQ